MSDEEKKIGDEIIEKVLDHVEKDPLDEEAERLVALTAEQMTAREDIVKAIGQRCNALMRYDGKDPALVASALLWCALSMYAQGVPDLTKDGVLLLCGATWDEAKAFLEGLKKQSEEEKSK